MKQEEHNEQVMLIQWWSLMCNSFHVPEICLFAIPNGGLRNIIIAAKMKREGVRSGIPDLFLACPRKDYHGLFIEMKKPKGGRVSDSQKTAIKVLEYNKYKTAVCHGWEQAKQEITEYLSAA